MCSQENLDQNEVAILNRLDNLNKLRSSEEYRERWLSYFIFASLILVPSYWVLQLLEIIRTLGFWEPVRANVGLLVLSGVISFLITPREVPLRSSNSNDSYPKKFWEFMYLISVREPSSLAMVILFLTGIGIGTYYFVTSFFKVEYTTSGFQINLPGQTIYYVPILPTLDKWQDTGIRLRKGDRVEVSIIGYASTTALWGLIRDSINRAAQVESLDKKMMQEIFDKMPVPTEWSDAAGIPETMYASPLPPAPISPTPNTINNLFSKSKSSKTDIGLLPHYTKDNTLTIKGVPHNTIVAMISDDRPPDLMERMRPYEWTGENNEDHLVKLSRHREEYPYVFDSKWSGTFWVTVNDAYQWKWDNSGMFFMSVKVCRSIICPQ